MYGVPDQMEVIYEGQVIFTTGGLVSGSQTITRYIDGTDTVLYVRMTAPNFGTGWRFRISVLLRHHLPSILHLPRLQPCLPSLLQFSLPTP